MGPSSGSRWIISTGFTRDMTSGAGDFTTVLGELRLYAQPLPVMVSATRVQAQSSFGPDAQRYYLGGLNTLRGYSRRSLSGYQTTLVQQEFRAPLLRGLTTVVPMAWMLPTVSGAVFADAAWGWDDGGHMQRLGSAGFGFYLLGGYYPAIRWNYIWTTNDFSTFSRRPRTTFSIWYNF
jgi:hemolysin activation/secretion protein